MSAAKRIRMRTGVRLLSVLSLPLLGMFGMPAPAQAQSICARVKIRIEQEAVITRTAFRATLEINNESDDALDQVRVFIDIRDAGRAPANQKFGIPDPTLINLSDVEGGGSVAPMTTATAQWLILPTDEAAPTPGPTDYFVGGEFSYVASGGQITVPLYPVRISVLPDAQLFFKYFLQSPVYSDNPFTTTVEPAEPFSLGLLVSNAGLGSADNLRITSSAPQIVENERGLLIAFNLLGAQVGTQAVSPSFTVNLGDIPPAGDAVARWLMTTSLQGRFIEYEATFEHVNGLGDPRLSLIEAVDIFELNHVVLLDDDELPDFLVNNPPAEQEDDLPDEIHSSDGSVLPVNVVLDAVADGMVSKMDLIVQVTADLAPGWNFIRMPDPGAGAFELQQAVRLSDGLKIRVGGPGDICNAWSTHRWLPIDGPPTGREDRLYIVDRVVDAGPQTYSLYFLPALTVADIRVNGGATQRSNVTDLSVTFGDETNLPALIASGSVTPAVSVWQRALGGGSFTPVPLDVSRYAWNAEDFTLSIDLTVDGPGGDETTLLAEGNYELRLETAQITSPMGANLADGDGTSDGVHRFGDDAADGCFRMLGDANADRVVNFTDLQIVRNSWLLSEGQPGFDPSADLNSDGIVNFLDLQLVRNNWLRTLPF